MSHFHFLDWAILAAYAAGLIWIGIFRLKDQSTSQEEFILSGRRLSLGGFVATLVTTWYGAILGVGENTFLYGIQTWFIFALPYYGFALGYAIWIAPKIREKKFLSIPDHFRSTYGENAGIISALFITFLASPAPYILSMGILLQFLFGITLGVALLISTIFSVIYVWNGGFSAVVKTDILQFILMFVGFFLLIGFSWNEFGSPAVLINSIPESHLDPLGGNTAQYVLVWFFIAAWTFVDPGFYQRCAAAKSPETAKKGLLISIGFWAVFDCLTVLSGLYAVALIQTDQPLLSFPLLGTHILPIGIFGLFITGILATIMSTIDSLSLISAITFGRDILWRIQRPQTNSNPVPLVRKGLVIISFLSLFLAFAVPSVVGLFYIIGSVLIPGLILPFVITLWNEKISLSERLASLWIVTPVGVSLGWFGISQLSGQPFMGIEPFYPGMVISFLFLLFIIIRTNNGH
ncbi:MAG TPA: sodium:solute symporter family protein [Candidatus Marinimicrobia bacterium]|nr:sodium:solute symporter family protein [Candidatus Neomarinimicrobiota bacterium]